MNRLSRPLIYGVLVVLSLIAFLMSGQSDSNPAKRTAQKAPRNVVSQQDPQFDHADYVARFDKPDAKARNPFVPLVEVKEAAGSTAGPGLQPDLDHIPADLAKGEANWIFTGMAEVDGVREALFENSQTHQGAFVKEGESWKACRVQSITGQSVVLIDSNGLRQVVMRFDPNQPAKAAATAPAKTVASAGPAQPGSPVNPMAPPMTGPIGHRLDIRPLPAASAGDGNGTAGGGGAVSIAIGGD